MAEGTEGLQASLDELVQFNTHMKKYLTLRKRCEQIQQVNEKLVNRLHHVKQMIKKCKKERRFLMNKLDEHGDAYKDAQAPALWEESSANPHATPPAPPPYTSGPSATPPIASGAAALLHAMGATPPPPYPQGASSMSPYTSAAEGFSLSSPGGASSSSTTIKPIKQETVKNTANAFLLYCQHRRPTLLEEYRKDYQEDMPQHELTKQLAQEWSTLTTEEKKIYTDLLEKEKEHRDLTMMQQVSMATSPRLSSAASPRLAAQVSPSANIPIKLEDPMNTLGYGGLRTSKAVKVKEEVMN